MQREFFYSFCLLLAVLLAFAAGCARAPRVIEPVKPEPKGPVEQQPEVITEPVETKPVKIPELPARRGSLVVISEPMGAEVYIDDRLIGTTPLVLKDVAEGFYRVRIELEPHGIWLGDVDIEDQKMAEVRVKLGKPSEIIKPEPVAEKTEVEVFQREPDIAIDDIPVIIQEPVEKPEEKEDVPSVLEEIGELRHTITSKDNAEMVLIPDGMFIMGSPAGKGNDDEYPQHKVFLNAFYIDKYEVTNAQYKEFMDATGHKAPKYWDNENLGQPEHPVVGISWNDAKAYCEWAGKRLPTEAEWEKAARGGLEKKLYPWGNEITYDNANYDGIGGMDIWQYTAPVGSFAPNGYGLYDMAGNVWEWCEDWYDNGYYFESPEQNPKGPSVGGGTRVMRGGSWFGVPESLRVARRGFAPPSFTSDNTGFRCARDARP